MPLSIETKDAMLRHAFAGTMWLALLQEDGSEVADANYVRQAVDIGAPITVITDELANLDQVTFPAFAVDSLQPVTAWALFDTQGTERARGSLPKARTPEKGDRPFHDAGDIKVRLVD